MYDSILTEAIFIAVKIIGGLILLAALMTAVSTNPRWVIVSILLVAVSVIISGSLDLIRIIYDSEISDEVYYLFIHSKTVFSCTGMGILITLFISGELHPAKWKHKWKGKKGVQE